MPTYSNKGLIIYDINSNSPFVGILNQYDIVLSATLYYPDTTTSTVEFGKLPGQYTLGVLLYTTATSVQLSYIKFSDSTLANVTVNLNKTYADVPNNLDVYLSGGVSADTSDKKYKISIAAPKSNSIE
jgi:hypothetical protein